MNKDTKIPAAESASTTSSASAATSHVAAKKKKMPDEVGGPKGPEPTRYGDWERKGIASDF